VSISRLISVTVNITSRWCISAIPLSRYKT